MPDALATDVYHYRDDASTWHADPVYARVLEQLAGLPRGARVLDAGCGNGIFAGRLLDLGFSVEAFDYSASGIEICRRRYPGIAFHCGDVNDLALSGFDAVTSNEVIEHQLNPRPFMLKLGQMVRPGGRLVMTTPYHGWLKNVAIAVTNRADFHYCCPADWGHAKFYSIKTLTQIIREAGFTNVGITGVGRVPYLWTSMVASATKLTPPRDVALETTRGITNRGGDRIDDGLDADLRRGGWARHTDDAFSGRVWFEHGQFHEEVWVDESPRVYFSGTTLQALMASVNWQLRSEWRQT